MKRNIQSKLRCFTYYIVFICGLSMMLSLGFHANQPTLHGGYIPEVYHDDYYVECDCDDMITDACITHCTGDIDPANPAEEWDEHDSDFSVEDAL